MESEVYNKISHEMRNFFYFMRNYSATPNAENEFAHNMCDAKINEIFAEVILETECFKKEIPSYEGIIGYAEVDDKNIKIFYQFTFFDNKFSFDIL